MRQLMRAVVLGAMLAGSGFVFAAETSTAGTTSSTTASASTSTTKPKARAKTVTPAKVKTTRTAKPARHLVHTPSATAAPQKP